MRKWSNSKSIRFSGISGYGQISLGHHALVEMMAENGARPVEAEGKLRIGLIGVTVIVAGVFAVTIILYTLKTVLGVPIPYPNITITITWALIALVGVWILGHTIQTTTSPLIGSASAGTVRKIVTALLLFVILFATLGRLGIDLSAYLVSLGVTAILVGFAAQTTIGNLIAGMVLVSKPVRRGDYVRVNITGGQLRVDSRRFRSCEAASSLMTVFRFQFRIR